MVTIKEYYGHIRNKKQLCSELGIELSLERRQCEEQIIIKAYLKWGKEVAEHILGSFAFALYDDFTDTLFCVRDQFGTVPFYYYLTENGELLYGSEIRSIMAQNGFVKELNEGMLQIYLSLTYVAGEDTFFKGLKKLLPGTFLTFKNGQVSVERYFTPEFNADTSKDLDYWANEIHNTMLSIMTEMKDEDEYVESFLSSGVDSSYLLAISDVKKTLSCGYEEERFDESALASEIAKELLRENDKCLVTPKTYFDTVPYVLYNMEQPLGDSSAIAFAIACKEAAKRTSICFSGEGADEFFGGYNIYRNAERYAENLSTRYVGNTNIMKEEEKQRILQRYDENILPINLVKDIHAQTEGQHPLSRMLRVDMHLWLEGDIFLNVFKTGKAAGLEIRMPFADMRIFNIASRIPASYKLDEENNKVALRTAASKVLSHDVAFRKKLGFLVPIRVWLADPNYNSDVIEKFSSKTAEKFFKLDEIKAILNDYLGGNSDAWRKVWTIYTFLVWYEEYFVKR